MNQRLHAPNRSPRDEAEAFNLDIVEFKEAGKAEEYLSEGYGNAFKYVLRSFNFFPKQKVQTNW